MAASHDANQCLEEIKLSAEYLQTVNPSYKEIMVEIERVKGLHVEI